MELIDSTFISCINLAMVYYLSCTFIASQAVLLFISQLQECKEETKASIAVNQKWCKSCQTGSEVNKQRFDLAKPNFVHGLGTQF